MKLLISFYTFLLVVAAIYSYGFVDPNLVLLVHPLFQNFHNALTDLVFHSRLFSTLIFISIISLFSIFYGLFIWRGINKKLKMRDLRWLIGLTVGILLLSYPAFSYDIFNYILTAKVAYFYHENPYVVMPIEFLGEANLAFTRAANKLALYGPSWIGLTSIPYTLSFDNVVLAILMFKLLIVPFYLGTLVLIYKFSKNIFPVLLFALNPLVIIETLIGAHNDIVMMFFALLAFYLIGQNKTMLSLIALTLSILVKYSTIILLPVFAYIIYLTFLKKSINWEKIYTISTLFMILVILVAPLREEIYPWYIIWAMVFIVLTTKKSLIFILVLALSLTSLTRYIPVLYTGSYFGLTPIIRETTTFIPLILIVFAWLWQKFIQRKFFG